MSSEPLLEVRGLVLRGPAGPTPPLDFVLSPGECVAVVGPPGSGKRGILRACAGLARPAEGGVTRREAGLAYVFEGGGVLAQQAVRDNVVLPLLFRGVPEHEAVARADASLDRLGLAAVADQLAVALDRGGAVLLQLARADALDVDLLCAEDPFAGLTHAGWKLASDWLLDRLQKGRTAALIATADRATLPVTDPRIVRLTTGRAHMGTFDGSASRVEG